MQLILTVEHIPLVCFVCFANRELVKFLHDVFQLLPFLGIVKGHSIKNYQGFRPDAVKNKHDLIGFRLLGNVHYNCVPVITPVFWDVSFYVQMTRQVEQGMLSVQGSPHS